MDLMISRSLVLVTNVIVLCRSLRALPLHACRHTVSRWIVVEVMVTCHHRGEVSHLSPGLLISDLPIDQVLHAILWCDTIYRWRNLAIYLSDVYSRARVVLDIRKIPRPLSMTMLRNGHILTHPISTPFRGLGEVSGWLQNGLRMEVSSEAYLRA